MSEHTTDNSDSRDQSLLDQFRVNSDLSILGELYSPYMHLVYGVCLKYLKDREKSQDAAMQIFEKLITEIPKHKINNFRSWLYVLTKNHCLMELRSSSSRKEREKKYGLEQQIFMESEPELHPVDEENSKLNKALQECIESLKKEQKECVLLFYYKDKCYREISEMLHLDEKKVKSYLQNGKRNLKICLENKDAREE
ncbi:MAG: RNA polymerase sigma factor [Bacteroidales bacterium]